MNRSKNKKVISNRVVRNVARKRVASRTGTTNRKVRGRVSGGRSSGARKVTNRRALAWSEWILVGIVAISAVTILVALVASFFGSPSLRAERAFRELTDDYYVEYLYPRLVENDFENPETKLTEYVETGAPTVYLRQLLHFEDDDDLEELFEEVGCDTNATSVRYFPTAPFGAHDYDVKYNWSCAEI